MDFERQRTYLSDQIKRVDAAGFDTLALEVFRFQAQWNPLYRRFLELLSMSPDSVQTLEQIPFLSIRFFKNKEIKTGSWATELVFESSGTTGQVTSKHELRSLEWYLQNTVQGFRTFYGPPESYCFLALLPSYLERQGSSLVAMADHFIKLSKHTESGFFLYDHIALAERLEVLKKKKIPTVLIGVSFGLLDFIEKYQIRFPELIVIETGGMKGRRKEMTRSELHQPILDAFQLEQVHSEYGMTELLSQAYAQKNGRFQAAPTMKVLIRDVTDPFFILQKQRHGAINIIDLANLDTCSFIATDDLGKQYEDHSFEVLGRLDASDLRGCNLMVSAL